jgi:hypothetical protein
MQPRTSTVLAALAVMTLAGCSGCASPAAHHAAAPKPAASPSPSMPAWCVRVMADIGNAGYQQPGAATWSAMTAHPDVSALAGQFLKMAAPAAMTDGSAQLGNDLGDAGMAGTMLVTGHGSVRTWNTDLGRVISDCENGD